MTLNLNIESSQSVTSKRVGTALKYDGGWSELLTAHTDDGFEKVDVLVVIDPILQRNVDGMMSSWIRLIIWACTIKITSSREKVPTIKFVNRQSQNTICGPKCLFHAVSVVDVDINVQDSWMLP
jgi:hypothetical protein